MRAGLQGKLLQQLVGCKAKVKPNKLTEDLPCFNGWNHSLILVLFTFAKRLVHAMFRRKENRLPAQRGSANGIFGLLLIDSSQS
jgi:hypothetical protein